MTVKRELWERALGYAVAEAIEKIQGSGSLETIAQSDAVKLLQKIQDILNDKSLSDFACVEEVVSVMAEFNVSTTRHDFG